MLMESRETPFPFYLNNNNNPNTQLPKIDELIPRNITNNSTPQRDSSSTFFDLVERSITHTNFAKAVLSKPIDALKLPPLPSVSNTIFNQQDSTSSGCLNKRTIAHLDSLQASSFYWNHNNNSKSNNDNNTPQNPSKIPRTTFFTAIAPLAPAFPPHTLTNSPKTNVNTSLTPINNTQSASSFLPSNLESIPDLPALKSTLSGSVPISSANNTSSANEPSHKITNSPDYSNGKQAPGKRKYSQEQWSQLRNQLPSQVKQQNILKLPFTMKQIVWSVIQQVQKDHKEGEASKESQDEKFKEEGDEEADEIGKLMSRIRNQTYVQLLSTSFFKQQPTEKGAATKRFGCPFECSKWVKGSGNLRRHIEWHLLKLEEDVRKKVKTTVTFQEACKLFLASFGL